MITPQVCFNLKKRPNQYDHQSCGPVTLAEKVGPEQPDLEENNRISFYLSLTGQCGFNQGISYR